MDLHRDSNAPQAHAIRCQVIAALAMAPALSHSLPALATLTGHPQQLIERAVITLASESIISADPCGWRLLPEASAHD